jgi:hypothetical protein
MIPNDPEDLALRYSRMPLAYFHKCHLISVLCGGDQIIIGHFRVTTRAIPILKARS